MKRLIVLNILLLLKINVAITGKFDLENFKIKTNLVDAVNKVVTEVFANEISTVNFIYPESSKNYVKRDFLEQLLFKSFSNVNIAVRLDTAARTSTIKGRRKRGTFFLIAQYKEFEVIYEKASKSMLKSSGLFVIVFINGRIPEIQEIFILLWKIQIYNVNVMFQGSTGTVRVETFTPFSFESCNDTRPIVINKFKNGKFDKELCNFFPEKINNLHKCTVRASIFHNTEPYIIPKRLSNGKYQYNGRDISIVETLSQSLNFKINYTYIGNDVYQCGNLSVDGPLKALFQEKADLSISNWFHKVECLDYFESTSSYISEQIVFIVPKGQMWTSIEKLIYPFSPKVWILITVNFLIGLFVIFVIKRRSNNAQNFVFGSGVTHPYFNMFTGFIGGTQRILPKNNFARFLLTLLLIESLIIRSLYQGSFYEQSHKRHKEVETIEEMVARGFTFYTIHGFADLFRESEVTKDR